MAVQTTSPRLSRGTAIKSSSIPSPTSHAPQPANGFGIAKYSMKTSNGATPSGPLTLMVTTIKNSSSASATTSATRPNAASASTTHRMQPAKNGRDNSSIPAASPSKI